MARFTVTGRCLALLAGLLLAACTTTPSGGKGQVPPALEPGVVGGIAWMRADNYLTFQAAWAADRVTAGPRARPATGYFVRAPDGKWSTGVNELEVTGYCFMYSVDLLLDSKEARAHQLRWVRDASGAYVSVDAPQTYFWLVGDAARLDEPPWPRAGVSARAGPSFPSRGDRCTSRWPHDVSRLSSARFHRRPAKET